MKGIAKFCVVVVVACVLSVHVVEARRSLTDSSSSFAFATSTGGSASASASSGPGSSSTAVAKSNSCGSATAVAKAKKGAVVKGKTVVDSDEGCPSATTVVEGEGEKGSVSATTVVKGKGTIDVTRFVKGLSNGKVIDTLALDLADEYEKYEYSSVVDSLVVLAGKEKTFPLFKAVLSTLLDKKGCTDFRVIFDGRSDAFIVYLLPNKVTKCIYPRCSDFGSASNCCGKAQLKQDQCSCADGKCLWKQPAKKHASVSYWLCNDCGENAPLCVCS